MKTCSKCKTKRQDSEFYGDKTSGDGLSSQCKPCKNKYYNAHKEERKTYQRGWNKRNTEHLREYRRKHRRRLHLKDMYGLTVEQYVEMLKKQDDKCAICAEIFVKTPHVDHDHATGKVRGLLCSGCNTAIGMLKDSPENAERAAAYLRLTP